MISPTMTMKQANELQTRFEITLNDDEIVDVCKRSILAAIVKVIVGEVFIIDHNY